MQAASNILFTPYSVQESTQNLTISSSLSAFSFPKISVHPVVYATKCDLLIFWFFGYIKSLCTVFDVKLEELVSRQLGYQFIVVTVFILMMRIFF